MQCVRCFRHYTSDQGTQRAPSHEHPGFWCNGCVETCELKPGVYRHHNGGLYRVLHTNVMWKKPDTPPDAVLVVYVSLENGMMYARAMDEFLGVICKPVTEGIRHIFMQSMPRFTREGP